MRARHRRKLLIVSLVIVVTQSFGVALLSAIEQQSLYGNKQWNLVHNSVSMERSSVTTPVVRRTSLGGCYVCSRGSILYTEYQNVRIGETRLCLGDLVD